MKFITPHLAKKTGSQIPQCSELEQQQQQFPHVSGLVLTTCTVPAGICQHSLGMDYCYWNKVFYTSKSGSYVRKKGKKKNNLSLSQENALKISPEILIPRMNHYCMFMYSWQEIQGNKVSKYLPDKGANLPSLSIANFYMLPTTK